MGHAEIWLFFHRSNMKLRSHVFGDNEFNVSQAGDSLVSLVTALTEKLPGYDQMRSATRPQGQSD